MDHGKPPAGTAGRASALLWQLPVLQAPPVQPQGPDHVPKNTIKHATGDALTVEVSPASDQGPHTAATVGKKNLDEHISRYVC
jgi:hypothetical protein